MQEIQKLKPFSVDVFSDHRGSGQSPWIRIGEFERLEEAVEACKRVVDDFLKSPINLFMSPDRLVNAFLNYGDVPAINGAENLKTFDVYQYLMDRCTEITNPRSYNTVFS
jgi:hypothetical protein